MSDFQSSKTEAVIAMPGSPRWQVVRARLALAGHAARIQREYGLTHEQATQLLHELLEMAGLLPSQNPERRQEVGSVGTSTKAWNDGSLRV